MSVTSMKLCQEGFSFLLPGQCLAHRGYSIYMRGRHCDSIETKSHLNP